MAHCGPSCWYWLTNEKNKFHIYLGERSSREPVDCLVIIIVLDLYNFTGEISSLVWRVIFWRSSNRTVHIWIICRFEPKSPHIHVDILCRRELVRVLDTHAGSDLPSIRFLHSDTCTVAWCWPVYKIPHLSRVVCCKYRLIDPSKHLDIPYG